MSMFSVSLALVCLVSSRATVIRADDASAVGEADYTIEGKLVIPMNQENFTDVIEATQIIVDGGAYIGLLKEDYSFEIKNVAPGSYLIQVAHPSIAFESVRVDISSKGAKRARRVNNLQPHINQQLSYPVKVRPTGTHNYFQQRETWRITDFLLHPMLLTMVLPLLLIMVLPKMMSAEDIAQTQRDVLNMRDTARMADMPELSEVMTSLLGGQQVKQGARGQGGNQLASGSGSKKKNS